MAAPRKVKFEDYLRNLGIHDTAIQRKYIGTIFSQQQNGFNSGEIDEAFHDRKDINSDLREDIQPLDDEHLILDCAETDFDPAIKFGRDNKLFLKRNFIEMLEQETQYNEMELQIIKELYTGYAEIGKGLNFARFNKFISFLYNVDIHPYVERLFRYFDKNGDGLVEYVELVRSMDIIEKGSVEEKSEFCFQMYDVLGSGVLDVMTLREVLTKAFVNLLIVLEEIVQELKTTADPMIDWQEFEKVYLERLTRAFPVAVDWMEEEKEVLSELENAHKFTMDSLENLWNIYRSSADMSESKNRQRLAHSLNFHDPRFLGEQQFKLVMLDAFKVKDPQLLSRLFKILDRDQSGYLDVRELVGGMIFGLKGGLDYKFAIFFDVFAPQDQPECVKRKDLAALIQRALTHFHTAYRRSKEYCDAMNTKLDGMISYDEYREFCLGDPRALDFLGRLTIGAYPPSSNPELAALTAASGTAYRSFNNRPLALQADRTASDYMRGTQSMSNSAYSNNSGTGHDNTNIYQQGGHLKADARTVKTPLANQRIIAARSNQAQIGGMSNRWQKR